MSHARAVTIMVLLALGVSTTWAVDAPPTIVVRPFSTNGIDGQETLSKSLNDTLVKLLRQSGFELVDGSESRPARFEARGLLVREEGNLVLQVSVVDLTYHSLVASTVLSVYDGLTALSPITNSLAILVRKAASYWELVSKTPLPVPPIQDPLTFTSSDEGARIFWQNHELAGTIVKGRLTAPYYPFPANSKLTVTIEKEGCGPETLTLTLRPDKTEYALPKLVKLRINEVHPFISTGRLLGFGVEYRRYFLPDWSFVGVEAYPFLQWHPGVGASKPVYHFDMAGSVGTWLYYPAHSWFRFGWEASLGLSQTFTTASATAPSQEFVDATVVPFGLLLEWNFWGLTLENRVQVPYSLGLSSGVLGPRWLLVDGSFPMISFGTVLQW